MHHSQTHGAEQEMSEKISHNCKKEKHTKCSWQDCECECHKGLEAKKKNGL